MSTQVIPLDPDSPKGREVADRLDQVLAEIWVEIQAEKSAAKRASTEARGLAA